MKNKTLFFTIFVFILINIGCEDKVPVKEQDYSLTFVNFQSQIVLARNNNIKFETQISPYSSADLNNATMQIIILKNETEIYSDSLYDDGMQQKNGDIIKYDGIFTNVVNSQVFNEIGNYKILVNCLIYGKYISIENEVSVINNKKPQIKYVSLGDTLFENQQNFDFTIADSNGLNDLDSIFINIYLDQNYQNVFTKKQFELPHLQTENYSLPVDSTFGVGMVGDKWIKIILKDLFEYDTFIVANPLFILNTPPFIFNVSMPDSAAIPSSGLNLIKIQAQVNDKRGLEEIKEVYFNVGTNKLNLFDNGDMEFYGDQEANDGIFSTIIVTDSTNSDGTYTFTFYASDKVLQNSAPIQKQITLYHP